jgi:hypothetical protein
MNGLWSAILNPAGPNYQTWREVLGSEKVPLKSSAPVTAELGTEPNVEVYLLDIAALTLPQRARLLGFIAQKFGMPVFEVEATIAKTGFPIRAADVIVSIGLRAVL